MNLPPVLKQRYFDSNGDPLVGGLLYTYQANTTTPQVTYKDSTGDVGTENTNPIELDANGEADMWLDPTLSYKFVLHDADDVPTGFSVDNVVGTLTNDSVGTNTIQDAAVTSAKIADDAITQAKLNDQILSPLPIMNYSLTAAVAANELVITLRDGAGAAPTADSPVKIPFRHTTAATGTPVYRDVVSAINVLVSSGSTLGHTSGKDELIHVYAIDNTGTVELAVSSNRFIDESSLATTVADGGGGGADLLLTLYANNARTNVPIRYLGSVKVNEAAAGTWATAPSQISVAPVPFIGPRSEVVVYNATGHGAVNTKIRIFGSVSRNVGLDITYATSPDDGDSFTINKDGFYAIQYTDGATAATSFTGISNNAAGGDLTTNVGSLTLPTLVAYFSQAAALTGAASIFKYLRKNDVIRPHTSGVNDVMGINSIFNIAGPF